MEVTKHIFVYLLDVDIDITMQSRYKLDLSISKRISKLVSLKISFLLFIETQLLGRLVN